MRSSPSPAAGRGNAIASDRALLWLTLAALLARVLFLLLEPRCELTGDEPSWIALGTNELGRPNGGLSPFKVRLIFYPPLYPYFIAILVRAFGSVKAVLWAQTALGALLVPAVGGAGTLVLGRRVGLAAAAFTAFYPELLWYPAHFWSETVYLLLLWWAIERTIAADALGSPRAAAVAGVCWGLATLTRELSLYLVPIAALWMLRRVAAGSVRGAADRVHAGRPALVLALATVLVIAPWTVRNALVFRALVPVSTMGGLNLWQGNTRLTHLQIYELLAKQGGAIEQDRYCRAMAWRTIAARQPWWLLEKVREQVPEFWKAGSEVLDHLVGREACGALPKRRLVELEIAFVAPYLAVLGLFLVGLARLRWSAGTLLLALLLAAYASAHVVAYATTRFRLPILPIVFLIASAGLIGREGQLQRFAPWRIALLGALLVLALLTLAPGLDELASWGALTGGA